MSTLASPGYHKQTEETIGTMGYVAHVYVHIYIYKLQ